MPLVLPCSRSNSATYGTYPPRGAQGVNATFTLFQRPGWDIHAVRHGNTGVTSRHEPMALQLSATIQVRWVSKSRVIWLTLKEGARTPTRDY
jgi:hypothetical protein